MNRPGEAIVHYQRAAELQTQMPIEALLSMGEMATCKILTREFTMLVHIWLCNWCLFYVPIRFWIWILSMSCRWLWWCIVSVHRHATDLPREGTAAAWYQHPCWWGLALIYRLSFETDAISAMQKIANLFFSFLKGAFLDIVAKCEISRVLLLMLLEVKHCTLSIFFTTVKHQCWWILSVQRFLHLTFSLCCAASTPEVVTRTCTDPGKICVGVIWPPQSR